MCRVTGYPEYTISRIKLVFQEKSSTILIERTDLVFPEENRKLLNGEENSRAYMLFVDK